MLKNLIEEEKQKEMSKTGNRNERNVPEIVVSATAPTKVITN